MRRVVSGMLALALVVAVGPAAVAGGGGSPAPDRIGLTFDDGPDPDWAPVILDILDDYGATVTFFSLGWKIDANPDLARDIVDRGHSLQIHGYHHNLFTRLSDAQIRSDLQRSIAAVYRATGLRPSCFRAPRGATNARVDRIANELGLTVVGWDHDTADYAIQGTRGILDRLLRAVPGQSILAHDNWGFLWKHSLPPALEEFAARGYEYDTVCENHGPYGRPRAMQVGIGAL